MVALLLEFGADRNAPATFWNCCCCKKTPTQFVDMFWCGCDYPAVRRGQRAPIKELLDDQTTAPASEERAKAKHMSRMSRSERRLARQHADLELLVQ